MRVSNGILKVPLGSSETCILSASLDSITRQFSTAAAAGMQFLDTQVQDSSGAFTATATSYEILNAFASAATRCLSKERAPCQSILNMCTLHKFNQASIPCKVLNQQLVISTDFNYGFVGTSSGLAGTAGGADGWKKPFPFVYQPANILDNGVQYIAQRVSLNDVYTADGSTSGKLKFRLYAYTFNGTFVGWEYLSDQLQLCGGDAKLLSNYLRFGTKSEDDNNNNTQHTTHTKLIDNKNLHHTDMRIMDFELCVSLVHLDCSWLHSVSFFSPFASSQLHQ